MSHDICFNMWRACQQDLTSDWVTLWISDTRQMACSVAYAVEHDLGLVAEESVVEMSDLAAEKSYTQAFELLLQILDVPRRINGDCRERDTESCAWNELIRTQDSELFSVLTSSLPQLILLGHTYIFEIVRKRAQLLLRRFFVPIFI